VHILASHALSLHQRRWFSVRSTVHRTHTLYRLAPEHFSVAHALDARAHIAPLAHTIRTIHPRRAAPASCAWCDFACSSCKLRAERPRRTAVHFFPHTRPPDTHPHSSSQHSTVTGYSYKFSQQHPTFTHVLAVGDACLVYQRLLVNSYCTSDLCSPHGLARPQSASCDRRAFGHSTMSDPADAWFPRPRTPPAPRRQKDDTHHGLLCPRAYCVSRTHTDATIPGALLMQAASGATSARSSCKLRWCDKEEAAAHFFPPDDDAWLDIHQHVCTPIATRATQP
jgi:hypothetical protein